MCQRRLGPGRETVPAGRFGDRLVHGEEFARVEGRFERGGFSSAREVQEAGGLGERGPCPERETERPTRDGAGLVDEAGAGREVEERAGDGRDTLEIPAVLPLRPLRIEDAEEGVTGKDRGGLFHGAPGAPESLVARRAGEALPGGSSRESLGEGQGEEADAAAEAARTAENLAGRESGRPVRTRSVEAAPRGPEGAGEVATRSEPHGRIIAPPEDADAPMPRWTCEMIDRARSLWHKPAARPSPEDPLLSAWQPGPFGAHRA